MLTIPMDSGKIWCAIVLLRGGNSLLTGRVETDTTIFLPCGFGLQMSVFVVDAPATVS